MLIVDKLSRTPIYEQVIQQIELHIRLGEYSPNQPLPSVRALSAQLGVNPNTLQKAYAELDRRGLTFTAPGSGRFTSENAKQLLNAQAHNQLGQFSKMAGALYQAGVSREILVRCIEDATSSTHQTEASHD